MIMPTAAPGPTTDAPLHQRTLDAVTALVVEHAHRLDHGQADRLHELYTPDGVLEIPPELGLGPTVEGRDALADWGRRRIAQTALATLHVCTNVRVHPLPDGRVGARCAVVVYRCPTADDVDARTAAVLPALVGEYEDVCERGPDGVWRFAVRRAVPMFIGAELRARAAAADRTRPN